MTPTPLIARYGRIRIAYSSFNLYGDGNVFNGIHWSAECVTARDGYLNIYSRSNDYFAGVRVHYFDADPGKPDLADWDSIVQGGLFSDVPPVLLEPVYPTGEDIDVELHDLGIPAGFKVVRVSTRLNRELLQQHLAADDGAGAPPSDPSELPEQFLLQIWDNPTGDLAPPSVLKREAQS